MPANDKRVVVRPYSCIAGNFWEIIEIDPADPDFERNLFGGFGSQAKAEEYADEQGWAVCG